jgi:23S rRNA pseudouridine2457 synthase
MGIGSSGHEYIPKLQPLISLRIENYGVKKLFEQNSVALPPRATQESMSRLILFNKPFLVLCQFRDGEGRPVLADYIQLPGIYPAGRLDHDSEGLLLLTDDGVLQSRIADPRWKLAKTYWVQVEGDIDEAALEQLRHGVLLKDGRTLPAEALKIDTPMLWERQPPIRFRASIPTTWISLTIREGRNRQVRRMTAAVGFPTLRLVRAAIGPWSVAELLPGQWEEIRLTAAQQREIFGNDVEPPQRSPKPVNTRGTKPATAASDPRPRRHSTSPQPSAPPRPPTPSSRKGRGS